MKAKIFFHASRGLITSTRLYALPSAACLGYATSLPPPNRKYVPPPLHSTVERRRGLIASLPVNVDSCDMAGTSVKVQVPYSGKFSYGANFLIFRMKPRDTKIKTAKILTIEILASNFERAIEHVEAASKRWRFITVFLAFERPSRLQWTRLHPLACYDNETQRGK